MSPRLVSQPRSGRFEPSGLGASARLYQREQNNPYEQDEANLETNRICWDTTFSSRLRPRYLEQAQLLPRMDGPLRNSRKATSSRRRESDSDASRSTRAFDRSRVARHYLSQVFRGSPSAMAFLSTLSTHHTRRAAHRRRQVLMTNSDPSSGGFSGSSTKESGRTCEITGQSGGGDVSLVSLWDDGKCGSAPTAHL